MGRYELVSELGEGGMATVFKARDKELRREVAIKVLFPHLAKRPDIVRRFHREARAAAGLDHPNILKIFDVGGGGPELDPPHIVMELVRGHSLLEEIEQRGPALAEIVASVGALLADALTAAHAASIVHRDIKPANVLVAQGGRLLLADFGVARLETEDSLVTKTGAVLGTPAYMSPEQATGDTATARSDLYSLGATLYQLATGSLPYAGSPAKVLASIATGNAVPAVRRRPAVGADLSRAIERLMSPDPEKRPATAAIVAAELRTLAKAGSLGEPREELSAYFKDPAVFVKERTPSIVGALVTAAHQAIDQEKLPRAMALADRASALAPDDPEVSALIATVTEGGRSSDRKRKLLYIVGAVVLAGGIATAGVFAFGGGSAPAPIDSGVLAIVQDSSVPVNVPVPVPVPVPDAGGTTIPPADSHIDTPADAAKALSKPDAATPRPDAHVDTPTDAAPLLPPDAAEAPPDAAPAADTRPGSLFVFNDTWCDVTIDGTPQGRLKKDAYSVPPGPHRVTCEQAGIKGHVWTRDVNIAPGGKGEARGTMLGGVFDVTNGSHDAVTIDGQSVARGATLKLKVGRYEVVDGAVHQFLDFRQACTLRDHSDDGAKRFDCFP